MIPSPADGARRRVGAAALALAATLALVPARAVAEEPRPAGAPPLPAAPPQGPSKTSPPSWMIDILLDNDVLAGRDQSYTNGVGLMLVSSDLTGRRGFGGSLLRYLPPFPPRGARRFLSVTLAQKMYTPVDLARRDLDPNDRPYAGVLTASLGLHALGPRAMDTLTFEAGIVGPHSFAGDVQKFFHRTFDWVYPNGWNLQLKDEAFLGFGLEHVTALRRPRPDEPSGWDAFVRAGGRFSNAFIGASAGAEVRMGVGLPDDFGSSPLRPENESAGLFALREDRLSGGTPWGFHVFSAVEVNAVGRDLTLDGNTFRSGPRVQRMPWTAEFSTGLVGRVRHVRLIFAYVWQTRQFRGQVDAPVFGSLRLSFLLKG